MSRWIWFLIAIMIGLGLGLGYGWWISPVEYVDTSPDSLKIDYRTDYVLMVAEAYKSDGDISLAMRRLALLGNTAPVETVYQAILFAQKVGYLESDIQIMQSLMGVLQANGVAQGTPP